MSCRIRSCLGVRFTGASLLPHVATRLHRRGNRPRPCHQRSGSFENRQDRLHLLHQLLLSDGGRGGATCKIRKLGPIRCSDTGRSRGARGSCGGPARGGRTDGSRVHAGRRRPVMASQHARRPQGTAAPTSDPRPAAEDPDQHGGTRPPGGCLPEARFGLGLCARPVTRVGLVFRRGRAFEDRAGLRVAVEPLHVAAAGTKLNQCCRRHDRLLQLSDRRVPPARTDHSSRFPGPAPGRAPTRMSRTLARVARHVVVDVVSAFSFFVALPHAAPTSRRPSLFGK
jgi:hypothetical protein